MMEQIGLILEGGGMRGVYTAGVTDFFLDQGLHFSHVYGVSAGCCVGCSFLSGQRGRAYHVMVDYLDDPEYCSWRSLQKTGDLFGADMVYRRIPEELNPYDYEAFSRYVQEGGQFFAVVTNALTGEPEYLPITDVRQDMRKIRASSSLPLLARIIYIQGKPYMDGGVADSIPFARAVSDGLKKNVVILTREKGYQKKPSNSVALVKARYRKYPKLAEGVKERHIVYNETLRQVAEAEEKGQAFVIRPSSPVSISRTEKNLQSLEALYEQGYADAAAAEEALLAYLQK